MGELEMQTYVFSYDGQSYEGIKLSWANEHLKAFEDIITNNKYLRNAEFCMDTDGKVQVIDQEYTEIQAESLEEATSKFEALNKEDE